jgi:hypothetical protein
MAAEYLSVSSFLAADLDSEFNVEKALLDRYAWYYLFLPNYSKFNFSQSLVSISLSLSPSLSLSRNLLLSLSRNFRILIVWRREVSARGLLFANFHNVSGKWSPFVKPYIDTVHKAAEKNQMLVRGFGRNPTAPPKPGSRFAPPSQVSSTLLSSDELDLSSDYLPYLALVARKSPRLEKPRT